MNNKRSKCTRGEVPRSYRDYSEERMQSAVALVKQNKMTCGEAEKKFGIPRRTIFNRVKKNYIKPAGGQTKLTEEEEETVVDVLITLADSGSPMTKVELKLLVFKYLEKKPGPDSAKMPTNKWLNRFLHRHRSRLTIEITDDNKKIMPRKD